jgi:hypothetical protein
MPTLALDGRVYFSSAVDRRDLVDIAPAYEVSVLMNRARSTILAAEVHEVNFTDLPGNKAEHILFSLSEGEVNLAVTDDASSVATFNMTPSGILILMNSLVTDLTITGVATSSVYDLIAGA